MVTTNGSTVTVPKWFAGFIGTILTASLMGLGGMGVQLGSEVSRNTQDIAVINSNRFTSGDAIELLQTLPDQHDYEILRVTLLRIEDRLNALHPGN
jgi:hypothetical protein